MDDMLRELRGLRAAADKARMAVNEGLEAVEDLRRGASGKAPGRAARPPQLY